MSDFVETRPSSSDYFEEACRCEFLARSTYRANRLPHFGGNSFHLELALPVLALALFEETPQAESAVANFRILNK